MIETVNVLEGLVQLLLEMETDRKACPACGLGYREEHAPYCLLERAASVLARLRSENTLRAAIHAASEALDPQHQGEQWPDPIAWDGRPLREQAADILALVESQIPNVYGQPQEPWEALARQLRHALGREEV